MARWFRKNAFLGLIIALLIGMYLFLGRGAPVPPVFADGLTLGAALERSAETGRPVLALASADWCGPCQVYKRGAMADAEVSGYIRTNFLPVYVDVDNDRAAAAQLGVAAVPATIVIRDGREVDRIEGLVTAARLMSWLREQSSPAVTPTG